MKPYTREILIPADVPAHREKEFAINYTAITQDTANLFLFACDHKLEHLNADFYGQGITTQAMHPEHLFRIAQAGRIGAMAAPLGLIARYARQYTGINFIAKLTAKTNLNTEKDPYSGPLWQVADAVTLQEQKVPLRGIGITVYLGSEYEAAMLSAAAEAIFHAHQSGLVAILWAYPRGSAVVNERDADLIAGAAGVATSLGADFVKVQPPQKTAAQTSAQLLQIATAAAGNTKLICSGGTFLEAHHFLHELYEQLHTGGAQGCATGRTIFQRPLPQAVALTNAIADLLYENGSAESAIDLFNKQQQR